MVAISSDVIRGYNDTMILYLLQKESSYGYEISKNIKALTNEKYIIKETTLYSAFTRMESNGYVESYSQEADNGKKRTYYRITQKGRDYYSEKCEEWNLTKEVVEKFITKDENHDKEDDYDESRHQFAEAFQQSTCRIITEHTCHKRMVTFIEEQAEQQREPSHCQDCIHSSGAQRQERLSSSKAQAV